MDNNKYPQYIVRTVRECLGLDEEDSSRDNIINRMSPSEVFRRCLEWEGIIGYNMRIISLIEDCWGIKIESEEK